MLLNTVMVTIVNHQSAGRRYVLSKRDENTDPSDASTGLPFSRACISNQSVQCVASIDRGLETFHLITFE
jgi:hypothetical protein